MKAWHPFFVCFADTKKLYTEDLVNAVVIAVNGAERQEDSIIASA